MNAYGRSLVILSLVLSLAACAGGRTPPPGPGSGTGTYKVGKPYKIKGKWYHPKEEPNYKEVGYASWYGPGFHGRKTANGEIFNQNAMTAAHTTLPMPTLVRVTNLKNGRKVIVRVNDRGPFAHNRIIDLSKRAAIELGFKEQGVTKVRVEYLGRADRRAKRGHAATQRLAYQAPVTQPAGTHSTTNAAPFTSVPKPRTAPNRPAHIASVEASQPVAHAAISMQPIPDDVAIPEPARGPAPVAALHVTKEFTEPDHRASSTAQLIYVQLGAFSDAERALSVYSVLQGRENASIATVGSGDDLIYRVRVGPLHDEQTAQVTLTELKQLGHEAAQIVRD